ncbi:MAG TPA: succinyl-diaminopimelate desuccinylase [Candidatus Binatia bacterium]|nr:succinyl-diaminopimelate desuccinylase [Candidatus Binatia bacterium]
MSVLALTRELIARRSLTPDDAGCCALIGGRLERAGFTLEWMNREGVTNLWAVRGDSGPMVVLAGHTDVVPTGPLDAWRSDPFTPVERDGYLYGRGAADMKSGLAAMVCAAESFRSARGRVALLITSDEEGPCRFGTKHVAEVLRQRGVKPDYAIVGEATSADALGDRIVVGRRGSLGCNLTVHGRQGHVAYPHKADNPIHRLAPLLSRLIAEEWDRGNVDFPATSFQVSNFNAGTGANNVIPGAAQVVFNFRYSPEVTADEIRARVTALMQGQLPKFDADWWHTGEPYFTRGGPLVEAARAAAKDITGRDPELFTGGGTSDGRFLAPLGTQVVEIGPVNETIHKVNECVRVDDLPRLQALYEGVLTRLLG